MGHPLAVPQLLGILNVTPDSFSDGGLYVGTELAVERAGAMLCAGADWIDVGGESTRPGSEAVDVATEISRVVPVIEQIVAKWPDALVSIDTSKADVAEAAIRAGAKMVNDVSAMADPRMASVVASAGVKIVLMHMPGNPKTMMGMTDYVDVTREVAAYLRTRVMVACAAGIAQDAIMLDPGIGFGKGTADNIKLIQDLSALSEIGCPVLIGASRKRFIGEMTGVEDASERVAGSIGVALAATALGAEMLRVHDVAATKHALQLYVAITNAE